MSSQQLGLASLGTAEVPKCATPSSFMYMEVCLGALAASLAANPKGESADFPLVATIRQHVVTPTHQGACVKG